MNRRNTWIALAAIAVLVLGLWGWLMATNNVTTGPVAVVADIGQEAALESGAAWLVATHQNADGGYTAFSAGADQAPSDPSGSLDALLALAAAQQDTSATRGYLEGVGNDLVALAEADGGSAGKAILALAVAGANPRSFGGADVVAVLNEQLAADGAYNTTTAFGQSLALLALAAVGEPAPPAAVAWLTGLQAENGSWDDGFGTPDNPDATAVAVRALLAHGAGENDPAVNRAVAFLNEAQLASGGWEYGSGFGENANSTSLVVQALADLGVDVAASDGPWARDGASPLAALLTYQSASGAFQSDFGSGPFDDFFATVQALPALAAGR